MNTDCTEDFSNVRKEIVKTLHKVAKSIEQDILPSDHEDIGILNRIEGISKELTDLESMTSGYFLNCLLSEYTPFSQEISRTIQRLRLKGHAACIVIERKDPVTPFLSQGVPIHAQITSPLMESIFNPESPLHQGAVYIKSDLIISASNVLPFTEKVFWDRFFVEREMAAIGLSERCDALVLLVSENGTPSFCFGGSLYPFSSTTSG